MAYGFKSRHKAAIASMKKGVQLSGNVPTFVAALGDVYAATGHQDEAQKILRKLQELSQQRYLSPYLVARIYAALGQKDEALLWLETAYRERAVWMVLLQTDPRFDDLRSDPRFQSLIRRMNFPALPSPRSPRVLLACSGSHVNGLESRAPE